jgi:hypothetical protein
MNPAILICCILIPISTILIVMMTNKKNKLKKVLLDEK